MTMKRVAAARETMVEELREYLGLAKLAPIVCHQVLAMTTATANELVTEEKLRFIAREHNHVEQRRTYERLLAGQLRCTRVVAMPRPPSHATLVALEPQVPEEAQHESTSAAQAIG